MNTLYYGDNLEILQRYIEDESVDLIYLDPPFQSGQNYNVLFAEHNGTQSKAQIKAFEDTWKWDLEAEEMWEDIVEQGGKVSEAMQAFRKFLGTNDMLAYLSMMAPRLMELKRVLKSSGSLFLHCDSTASHYLKMLLDSIFSPQMFVNEIIWKRTYTVKGNWGQGSKLLGPNTDIIFYYRKTERNTFNPIFLPYTDDYINKFYKYTEPDSKRRYRLISMIGPGGASKGNPEYEIMGITRYWRYSKEKMDELIKQGLVVQTKPGTVPVRKQYLDEGKGVALQTLWDDIRALGPSSKERLGYPTQKPVTLLERIIKISSNEADIVFDPFCGCGTTIDAAQKLNRKWVGIDITHLAISLIKHRLRDTFGENIEYEVIGEPIDLNGAAELAKNDPYQFQWWALGLVGARPIDQKKGADQGIDGRLYFHDEPGGKTKQIIISVKSGKTSVAHIRDLRGVIDREKAEIGVLITLQKPTQPMISEAASAGFYQSPWGKHPRLQILTIRELLSGKKIDYPPSQQVDKTFKKAPKHTEKTKEKTGKLEFKE